MSLFSLLADLDPEHWFDPGDGSAPYVLTCELESEECADCLKGRCVQRVSNSVSYFGVQHVDARTLS